MHRRTFLTLGAAGALGVLRATRNARAEARAQIDVPYGESRLGVSETDRDGTLYVPKTYRAGVPMPIAVMLHGFGGSGRSVRYAAPAEEFGVIVVAPDSRRMTWGQSAPGFDEDVRYIGAAYRYTTGILDVDREHVALGGVSDGASYALSMGLAYGDVFNHVMVFSEGIMAPFRWRGQPRIFIAHGTRDVQMPIEQTSRRFVPALQEKGYDVTFREYDGGHGAPAPVVREGFEWFVAS